jgi:hypothetical protein
LIDGRRGRKASRALERVVNRTCSLAALVLRVGWEFGKGEFFKELVTHPLI